MTFFLMSDFEVILQVNHTQGKSKFEGVVGRVSKKKLCAYHAKNNNNNLCQPNVWKDEASLINLPVMGMCKALKLKN